MNKPKLVHFTTLSSNEPELQCLSLLHKYNYAWIMLFLFEFSYHLSHSVQSTVFMKNSYFKMHSHGRNKNKFISKAILKHGSWWLIIIKFLLRHRGKWAFHVSLGYALIKMHLHTTCPLRPLSAGTVLVLRIHEMFPWLSDCVNHGCPCRVLNQNSQNPTMMHFANLSSLVHIKWLGRD